MLERWSSRLIVILVSPLIIMLCIIDGVWIEARHIPRSVTDKLKEGARCLRQLWRDAA